MYMPSRPSLAREAFMDTLAVLFHTWQHKSAKRTQGTLVVVAAANINKYLRPSAPVFLQVSIVILHANEPDVFIHVALSPNPTNHNDVMADQPRPDAEASLPIITLVRREQPCSDPEKEALEMTESAHVAQFLGHIGSFLFARMIRG